VVFGRILSPSPQPLSPGVPEERGLSEQTLKDLSLYYYDKDKNLTAPEAIDRVFPKGFVQLVKALADAADQCIRYNCVVKQIEYDANGVTVATNQGDFCGKYAVITLPLGVLQKCQGKDPLVQFYPPLPDWKLGAINRLGMGRFDKLAMRFPTNFWGKLNLLHNMQQTSHFTIWFTPMADKPILVPLAFADFAKKLETVHDDKVVSMLMDILKPWFAAQNPSIRVPDLVKRGFQRSNWGADQFAFGSYSYLPPGSCPVDRDILSLAVPFALAPSPSQRLFFAGEATHRDHPSSVWGAYESGLREAFRLWLIAAQSKSMRDQAKTAGKQRFLGGKVNPASIWRVYNNSMKAAYRIAGGDREMKGMSRTR
jgi:monoamine oxidase